MSGAWFQALPASSLGLRLGDDELRIAVGLRLGAPSSGPTRVIATNRSRKTDITTSLAGGRGVTYDTVLPMMSSRVHSEVPRSLIEVPDALEPQGLLRRNGKRPDGATLIP